MPRGVADLPACCLFAHRDHVHMHEPPPYPYLKIRNKPLPWGDGTKDLLDVRDTYIPAGEHH